MNKYCESGLLILFVGAALGFGIFGIIFGATTDYDP